jgi:uncharacterized protein YacL
MLLYIVRGLFIIIFCTVLFLSLNNVVESQAVIYDTNLFIGILAAVILAIVVLVIDWLTPKKVVSSLAGVFFGLLVGILFSSLVASPFIEAINMLYNIGLEEEQISMSQWLVSICICYLTVSIVIRTKDDVRFIIPYVEFARQSKGIRPLVLDSSVIIDGRIAELVDTKVFDAPFIVPRFILNELQLLSDSADKLKRARGRRGLDLLAKLQANPHVEVTMDDTPPPGVDHKSPVDHKLVAFTKAVDGRLVTTDFNLAKVAQLRDLDIVNINDIARALRPVVLPGEELVVTVLKAGEEDNQGIAYLEDGTMVVVDGGNRVIGKTVSVTVTSSLQTSAGKMIFARFGQPNGNNQEDNRGRQGGRRPESRQRR